MTTYPALTPSSRVFTPGEYPATAFSGYSGAQGRARHSNVFIAAQLRLSYIGLSEAQMLQIWNHYAGQRGTFEPFTLPVEALSGSDIAAYVPATYRWIYGGPGQVEDLPCGGHNVSLTLETVAPVSASVTGVSLRLRLILAAGTGSALLNGLSETITLSLSAGVVAFGAPGIQATIALALAAGAAIGNRSVNGLAQSIALQLAAGQAIGDQSVNGLSAAIPLALAAGQVLGDSSVNGVDEVLTLSLANGEIINAAAGIAEALTLSLTPGIASPDVAVLGINKAITVGLDAWVPEDPYFLNVSLLLHMDGANGSTTFTDSSQFGRTMTAKGDAQISTAQSVFGDASGLMTLSTSYGDDDGLTTAVVSDLYILGSEDFTIEFFAYSTSTARQFIISSTVKFAVLGINVLTPGTLNVTFASGSGTLTAAVLPTTPAGILPNRWYHYAITRSNGNQTRVFLDGQQIGSTYVGWDSSLIINEIGGGGTFFGDRFQGYIDELRITRGVARYVANFVPPTGPFPGSEPSAPAPTDPDFASVSLLLHMDGSDGSTTFTDSSSYARTITPSGNTQISTAESKFGGASALFVGSANFLNFSDASELEMTGDFTIECFAYSIATFDQIIAAHTSQNVQLFRINFGTTGSLAFFLYGTYVFGSDTGGVAADIVANQWQHLAISRSGSTTRMFVDGTQKGSSNTSWTGSFKVNRIGGKFNIYFNGYIDDFRITKGVARYTANFTPPTAPFPDS